MAAAVGIRCNIAVVIFVEARCCFAADKLVLSPRTCWDERTFLAGTK